MCIICLLTAGKLGQYNAMLHKAKHLFSCHENLLFISGDTWTETLAYVLFWGVASAVTAAVIIVNGREFVDAPKLVQKEKMD